MYFRRYHFPNWMMNLLGVVWPIILAFLLPCDVARIFYQSYFAAELAAILRDAYIYSYHKGITVENA